MASPAPVVDPPISSVASSIPQKKKRKKKKDNLDLVFDILERTIDVLLRATPRLLEALSEYLDAGGDPADPKLRSLVSSNEEAVSYLDAALAAEKAKSDLSNLLGPSDKFEGSGESKIRNPLSNFLSEEQ